MYCHGSITVEWAVSGMQKTPEISDLLIEALPLKLERLLSDLS